MRRLLLGVLLLSSTALADGIDGWGRISVGGGFRWIPNWYFIDRAAQAGTPVLPGLSGGPQLTASFGYGVSSALELSIDLFGGFETINLALPDGQKQEYTSGAYGVLLGGRFTGNNVFFKGFMPYLAVQAGPLLSAITSRVNSQPERVLLAFSASAGATWRFADRYGISLEARYINSRSVLSPISGINVGGVAFSALFTIFFPPPPKRDLDVPGF
ncbi:MAG: hypothetical protein Q8L48_34055 [Archangium sp.]|nr:hypothetical protein [Archangium sp.]